MRRETGNEARQRRERGSRVPVVFLECQNLLIVHASLQDKGCMVGIPPSPSSVYLGIYIGIDMSLITLKFPFTLHRINSLVIKSIFPVLSKVTHSPSCLDSHGE